MRLAIASPRASAYSETFIAMQFNRLRWAMRIHGSPVAQETFPGGPIAPLRSLRGMWDIFLEVAVKGTKGWAGPQRRELKRRLKRQRINVVLANYGPPGVALLPVTRALDIPLLVHFHGFDAHRTQILSEHADAYRELGRDAAAIIVVSTKMAAALTELGLPPSKIHLIRYGVDPDQCQPRTSLPEVPVFFGVGRFVDKKAPYLTLLAFKYLHERYPQARLILAGDGPLLETTKNLAGALGLGHAVDFPGVLAHEKVMALMQGATAFVQHSLVPTSGPSQGDSEGTPVAVLEAMMSGLPVVATRHAGIGEVIEQGRTGLLVEERDVEGMARAMMQLLEQPDWNWELGQAARREALEKYTAAQYVAALLRLIQSVSHQ